MLSKTPAMRSINYFHQRNENDQRTHAVSAHACRPIFFLQPPTGFPATREWKLGKVKLPSLSLAGITCFRRARIRVLCKRETRRRASSLSSLSSSWPCKSGSQLRLLPGLMKIRLRPSHRPKLCIWPSRGNV